MAAPGVVTVIVIDPLLFPQVGGVTVVLNEGSIGLVNVMEVSFVHPF